MKIRVDRDVLAEAVAWTARALPARPAVPVLAGMRLQAGAELMLPKESYFELKFPLIAARLADLAPLWEME